MSCSREANMRIARQHEHRPDLLFFRSVVSGVEALWQWHMRSSRDPLGIESSSHHRNAREEDYTCSLCRVSLGR